MPALHLNISTLADRFAEFNATCFDNALAPDTDLRIFSEEGEEGGTRRDGLLIVMNEASVKDWECTLLHEMVHAYIYQGCGLVEPTDEGIRLGRKFDHPIAHAVYGDGHCACFFTKLLEINTARGHTVERNWGDYFA